MKCRITDQGRSCKRTPIALIAYTKFENGMSVPQSIHTCVSCLVGIKESFAPIRNSVTRPAIVGHMFLCDEVVGVYISDLPDFSQYIDWTQAYIELLPSIFVNARKKGRLVGYSWKRDN